jgi:hypothetical protein
VCLNDDPVSVGKDDVPLDSVLVRKLSHQGTEQLVEDDAFRLPCSRPRPIAGKDPAKVVSHRLGQGAIVAAAISLKIALDRPRFGGHV